jgi:hypothetical protein
MQMTKEEDMMLQGQWELQIQRIRERLCERNVTEGFSKI